MKSAGGRRSVGVRWSPAGELRDAVSVSSVPMLVLVVIEAVVLAFLALLVAGLLRSHAEILRALHDM